MDSSLKIYFYQHGPSVGCVIGENAIEGVAGYGDTVSDALIRLAENVKRVENGYFTHPEIDLAVLIHELNRISKKSPSEESNLLRNKGLEFGDE